VSIAGLASPKCESTLSRFEGNTPMLAEKFMLLLETLKSHSHPDGSPRVVSTSPHVPVKLPNGNAK
jgi:hypothetical protein